MRLLSLPLVFAISACATEAPLTRPPAEPLSIKRVHSTTPTGLMLQAGWRGSRLLAYAVFHDAYSKPVVVRGGQLVIEWSTLKEKCGELIYEPEDTHYRIEDFKAGIPKMHLGPLGSSKCGRRDLFIRAAYFTPGPGPRLIFNAKALVPAP